MNSTPLKKIKPSRLKDKLITTYVKGIKTMTRFDPDDIVAAVVWLKEKLCICRNQINKCGYCENIDEAFEDVIVK